MVLTKSVVPTIKRLFWDIEVSPNVVLAFRAGYEQTINHDAIIHERKIICIGYKWAGDAKPTVLRWSKDQDDEDLLRDFLLVAADADELVAHFGDRFDLLWLRTRCLLKRLPPIPQHKTIDTKAWAAKHFYFNSNKLDYISQVLGHGAKEKMEFEDWKKITLFNDKKTLDKMCHYCGVDVDKLELVYNDMAPYMKPKSHVGVMGGMDKWTCPWTGSDRVAKDKTRTTASGTVQHQMKSLTNGGYFTISDRAYREYQDHMRKKKKGKGKNC